MRGYVPDLIAFTQGGPYLLIALVFGYLLGSIPFGVVMAKVFGLGNLRDVGSGNIGATNVLRTGSKKAAILTLLFDMLKGTVAVLIAAQWGHMTAAVAGFGAFLGHCFPIWLKFKGGKGVATFLGAFLGLHWPTFLVMGATWLVVAFVTKISSLSALIAAAAAPIILAAFGANEYVWIAVPMALLLWWRHHENIGRLLKGEETKISFGKK